MYYWEITLQVNKPGIDKHESWRVVTEFDP